MLPGNDEFVLAPAVEGQVKVLPHPLQQVIHVEDGVLENLPEFSASVGRAESLVEVQVDHVEAHIPVSAGSPDPKKALNGCGSGR
jgi:hypothetical protein